MKKYASEESDQDNLVRLTFEKFSEVNTHMRAYVDPIEPPRDLHMSKLTPWEQTLKRAKALMAFVLTPFTEEELFAACRHSTGSTLGVSFSDTSWEQKFRFPITGTARVKPLVDRYLSYDKQLCDAIEDLNGQNLTGPRYKIVSGSRASTVEKNSSIRRMIAVEPTWNMFFQQGLMVLMYKRMKAVGLDVERLPDLHRQLAHRSSITGNDATIDWSSASDCVSIGLLRWQLPPKWFDWVDLVRCPVMSLDGDTIELNMFSTMGNAVTFPLETLVFWTFGHAVLMTLKQETYSLYPEWADLKSVSVFGDDCIVPTFMAETYIAVMESVGFICNREKSHIEATRFRESCGGDYYAGYNVRPYCVRAPSSTKLSSLESWLYVMWNSLLKRYFSYFGEMTYVYDKELWRVFAQLFASHKLEVKLVPGDYPDDAGLKISFDLERWSRHYDLVFSEVSVDTHGTYRFHYRRFQYRNRYERFGHLRFAMWLKNPRCEEEVITFNNVRRIGGYVEAVGFSCHWHVPRLKS
jgi:hypothetical protein